MGRRSFDPAMEFLLGMQWPNLFTQRDRDGLVFECKGCDDTVKVFEREAHFNRHKGALKRSEAARARRAEQQRLANLEKARAARQRQKGASI